MNILFVKWKSTYLKVQNQNCTAVPLFESRIFKYFAVKPRPDIYLIDPKSHFLSGSFFHMNSSVQFVQSADTFCFPHSFHTVAPGNMDMDSHRKNTK